MQECRKVAGPYIVPAAEASCRGLGVNGAVGHACCRLLLAVSLLALSCGVLAQHVSSGGDRAPRLDLQPVPASSVHYRDSAQGVRASNEVRFKFKSTTQDMPAPPPSIPGQASWMRPAPVMGAGKIGPDGRPPVDCQRTPMDRQCR